MLATITGTIDIPATPETVRAIRQYSYRKGYEETSVSTVVVENGILRFPRNLKKFSNFFGDISFEDKRVSNKVAVKIEVADNFNPHEFQEKALKEVLEHLKTEQGSCILQAGAGSGKTFTLPFILSALQERTLILVDRTDLAQQMIDEITGNTKQIDCKLLSKNDKELADVNITTFQFLLKNKDLFPKLKEEIGLVVVDECHLISVGQFTEIASQLPARYRYGLSATPTRSDGLTQALFDFFGNAVVNGTNPSLNSVFHLCLQRPYSAFIRKNKASQDWNKFYCSSSVLNEIIQITQMLLRKGRAVLIYSTSQEAQQTIKDKLEAVGIKSEILNSTTPKKSRKESIKKFEAGELDVLIAGTVLQKGVSIYRLDTVINFANHTKESLEQTVGRLRRDHANKKQPMFIDFQYQGAGSWKARDRKDTMLFLQKAHGDTVKYLDISASNNLIKGVY